MAKGTVLIVDDEKSIAEAVKYTLEKEGFRTLIAHDGAKALETARQHFPDLLLLDWMLPEVDGLEVCRLLKQDTKTQHIPIIMLTVRSAETDKVLGLEMGADDYMTKPFSSRELLARVKAVLRRTATPQIAEVTRIGEVQVDWGTHVVRMGSKLVELTAKEFALLKVLIEAKGRVISRDALLERAWGYERSMEIETRTVDLHISQLRRKLKRIADRIVTVKGTGYRLVHDE